MKRNLSKILTSLALATTLSFGAITTSQAAAETYILDPSHTYILWHANHLGFSNLSGKWLANGTLELDKDHPDKSKVNVTINVADLITAIPELDKHLKGTLFFDVSQYPVATFVSNKITVMHNNTAKINGMLTVHGVSKPITLEVKLNKT